MTSRQITKCRVCQNSDLKSIVNLGEMYFTGIFPKSEKTKIPSGILELVKCDDSKNRQNCGLAQLRHKFNLNQLYGDNYGYRSGLNKSMVEHLQNKVKKILKIVRLSPGDLVIDIASNDSTLLQAYPKQGINLIGIDPTGKKFIRYYPKHIDLIPEFFPSKTFKDKYKKKKAKIITSIAMFYDLDDPVSFAKEIYKLLSKNGVWVFEQSYLPTMLKMFAYDTICHEHIEYYALKQIKYILDQADLKIVNIEFNAINGGSFSITAAKKYSNYPENIRLINTILKQEQNAGIDGLDTYRQFAKNIQDHKNKLKKFIDEANKSGKTIIGYGASTKGNVVLQYCGIKPRDIPFIAEVNENKFGCFTPGSLIPIISEQEARKLEPDYFLILPWHFKDNIIAREKKYLSGGGKLFFPLPELTVV